MKMLLRTGILLFSCAHFGFCASIVAKRETEEGKQQVTAFINSKRAEWAGQYELANMHELKYDHGLEKIAEKLTCQSMAPGSDYMVSVFPNDKGLKLFLTGSQQQQQEAGLKYFGGFIAPEQTKFGCASLSCSFGETGIDVVCAVGPKNSFSPMDAKKGPAGSQCPNGKSGNGLCASNVASFQKATLLYFFIALMILIV